MSEDRPVATDALQTLGTIIDARQKRDAIHLAVENCVASEILYPGERIGLIRPGVAGKSAKTLGIVDPFLDRPVSEGENFWLIVLPRQITSLRHVWSHPDFDEEPVIGPLTVEPFTFKVTPPESVGAGPLEMLIDFSDLPEAVPPKKPAPPPVDTSMSEAIAIIAATAADKDVSYEEMLEGATAFQENGEWFYHPRDAGRFEGEGVPDEFWAAWEKVTGKKVRHDDQYFFSCSC